MQFKVLSAVTLALSATQAQATYGTAGQVAEVFDSLTKSASNVVQIGATMNPVTAITNAPRMINNMRELLANVGEAAASLGDPANYDFNQEDQQKICNSISNFLNEAEEAVDVLIGDSSIIGATPFVRVAGAVISQIAESLKDFFSGVLQTVPSCAPQLEQQFETFTETYEIRFNYRMADQAGAKAKVAQLEKEVL